MENITGERLNDNGEMKEKVRVVRLDDPAISKTNIGLGNNANASVWSLCDINNDDSHVDLGDITPSISPVFTEEQVLELTEQQMVDPMTHRLLDDGDNIFSVGNIDQSLVSTRQKGSFCSDFSSDLEMFNEMKKMGELEDGVSRPGHLDFKELGLEARASSNKECTNELMVGNVESQGSGENMGNSNDPRSVSSPPKATQQRRSPRKQPGLIRDELSSPVSPDSGMALRWRNKRNLQPAKEKDEGLVTGEEDASDISEGKNREQEKKAELDKVKRAPGRSTRRSSRIAKHAETEAEQSTGEEDEANAKKESETVNTAAPLPAGESKLTTEGENVSKNLYETLQETMTAKATEAESKVEDSKPSVVTENNDSHIPNTTGDEKTKDDVDGSEIQTVPDADTPQLTPRTPEKRVTRSTTGNLKPKQAFEELQEKQAAQKAKLVQNKVEEPAKFITQEQKSVHGNEGCVKDRDGEEKGAMDTDLRLTTGQGKIDSKESPEENKEDNAENEKSNVKKKKKREMPGSKSRVGKVTKSSAESSEGPSESSDEEVDFHADDSDYSPEDDPDRLWCICRKRHSNRFMICCDQCEEWFHGKCVGITMEQGRKMERNGREYVCTKCKEKRAKALMEEKECSQPVETAVKLGSPMQREIYRNTRRNQKDGPAPVVVKPFVVVKPPVNGKPPDVQLIDVKPPDVNPPDVNPPDVKSKDVKSKDVKPTDVKPRSSAAADASSEPEEKKRKPKEPIGYKIPKKVRTTPTPPSHSHELSRNQRCIAQGCPRTSFDGAVYCGKSCIERHVSESIKMLSGKEYGGKPLASEGNRVAVIEKCSGRVIAGMAAPVMDHLTDWILRNPSFHVLVAGTTSSTSHPTSSFYNKSPIETKVKKEVDRKTEVETIRSNVRRTMKEILVSRKRESSDIRITVEEIMKLVGIIEEGMHKSFKDTSHRYKAKYRTLMFNLKDPRNKVLYRRVLTGDIPPEKLIWMNSDELATKELAEWREQETKHMIDMIKKEEENSIKARLIKKTHKGEVDMDGAEDFSTLETSNTKEEPEEVKKSESEEKFEILLIDTTEEHRAHLFDLNCKICTGKMVPPGEVVAKSPRTVASNAPIQAAAESSIPSPPREVIISEPPSPDSGEFATTSSNPKALSKQKEKSVWKGFVMMQSVAKFGTNAYVVSGSAENLFQVLPDTLHVHGRIAHEQVWDYVFQCKTSPSREMCLIRFAAATDDEKISYVSLYSYFHSRKRCGVIGNCSSGVKDMYLIPLASHQPVPPELLPFKGPGLQEPRPHMLLGLIIRTKVGGKRARSATDRIPSTSPHAAAEPPTKQRAGVNGTDASKSTPPNSKSNTPMMPDSPVDEIEDIVFHFHNSQAKLDAEVPAKPQPLSSTQAIAPMISALLRIQEQEKKLRVLKEQSESLEKEMAPKKAALVLDPSISSVLSRLTGSVSSGNKLTKGAAIKPDKSPSAVVDPDNLYDPDSLYDPETAYDEETPYDPEDLDLCLEDEGASVQSEDASKPSDYVGVAEPTEDKTSRVAPDIGSVLPPILVSNLSQSQPESDRVTPGAALATAPVVDTPRTIPDLRPLLEEFGKRSLPQDTASSDARSRNLPNDPRSSRFRSAPAQDTSQSRDLSETTDFRQNRRLSEEPLLDGEESKSLDARSRPNERRWSDDRGRDRHDVHRQRDDRPRDDRQRDDRPRDDRQRDDRPRDDRQRDDRPRDDRQRAFADRDRSHDRERNSRDKWRR